MYSCKLTLSIIVQLYNTELRICLRVTTYYNEEREELIISDILQRREAEARARGTDIILSVGVLLRLLQRGAPREGDRAYKNRAVVLSVVELRAESNGP